MAPITIWHFPSSPPSWAVRMTASLLKLPVELKLVKIYELEGKTAEFKKMNPAGAVPVIKDGDLYVSERPKNPEIILSGNESDDSSTSSSSESSRSSSSREASPARPPPPPPAPVPAPEPAPTVPVKQSKRKSKQNEKEPPKKRHAIMKYLLAKYGDEEHEGLYPSDIVQRAAVDQIIFYNCGFGFSTAKRILLSFIFGGQTEFTPKNIKDIEDIYETVEMFIDKKDYVATNEFTIADLSMGSAMISMETIIKVDEVKYPFVAAWLNRLRSKAVFQEIVSPGVDYLNNLFKDVLKRNLERKANL